MEQTVSIYPKFHMIVHAMFEDYAKHDTQRIYCMLFECGSVKRTLNTAIDLVTYAVVGRQLRKYTQ